jgi:hypothetical protein
MGETQTDLDQTADMLTDNADIAPARGFSPQIHVEEILSQRSE